MNDCHSMVEGAVGDLASDLLSQVLVGSTQPPPPDIWGDELECYLEEVPVIDPGFDTTTFISGTVSGLEAHTPAAAAGLRDGDVISDLPRYEELVNLSPGQGIKLRVAGSQARTVAFRPYTESATVPQWRLRSS